VARLPDAAVCDTHALAYYGLGDRRLGKRAAAFFDACEEFEFVLARRLTRASTPLRDFFEDLFANPAFQPLDLTPEQVYLANEARPNDDPFDGLICAAARRLDVPLITRDAAIVQWGKVRIVW
jgi:PIN domain nuclease of toxin-antitoxin system